MDGGETDTGQGGAGVETATTSAFSSSGDDVYDLAVEEDDDDVYDLAVEEDDDDEGTGAAPAPTMMRVVVAISMKRPRGPRVPRPRRRRAVARPPAGYDHGARRSKEFMQWREWYLRKQRREKEQAWLCYVGIPPPGSWI